MTYVFELNGFKETLTICRWTFLKSSIFSELQCFASFLRIQENFRKKLKTIVISKSSTKDQIIFKETIVYGCLQCGVKQNSFTLLVCDLEI